MKAITCEMCGGIDLVKQDGYFVCQSCGMKYSLEEAKKLMIDGTVDVQGTVKVDNSAFVEKYLVNARRAKQKEDWEEVEKYYNMVEQNDPTNIEAIFYSAYGKAKCSLSNKDIMKRKDVFKVLKNCISIIDDNYSKEKEKEEKQIIEQITTDLLNMVGGNFVYNIVKTEYYIDNDKSVTENLFISLIDEYIKSLGNIVEKYNKNEYHRIKYIFLTIIKLYEYQRDNMNINSSGKNFCNERIIDAHTNIKEFEPNHEIPQLKNIRVGKRKKKGKFLLLLGIFLIVLYIPCIFIGIDLDIFEAMIPLGIFVLIGSIVLIVMGSVYIKDDKISDEKEHERQEYLMKK